MVDYVKCPVCANKGLEIDLKDTEKVVFTGRQLKDFPFFAFCEVCKRKIRYDIVVKNDG